MYIMYICIRPRAPCLTSAPAPELAGNLLLSCQFLRTGSAFRHTNHFLPRKTCRSVLCEREKERIMVIYTYGPPPLPHPVMHPGASQIQILCFFSRLPVEEVRGRCKCCRPPPSCPACCTSSSWPGASCPRPRPPPARTTCRPRRPPTAAIIGQMKMINR